MLQTAETTVKWGLARRLAFIDFRLCWERRINRSDLIDFFGISPQQASADLQEYLERAKDQVEYDKSAKTYVAMPSFTPKFVSADPRSYFDQLAAQHLGVLDKRSVFIGTFPEFDLVEVPQRHVETVVLIRLLDALRNRQELEIQYQSMSSPDAPWQTISPHAFASDGLRWHVRAFSHKHQEFRDFVMARIVALRNERQTRIDPANDAEWNRNVTIKFGPHPELSDAQRKAIEREYEMKMGEKTIKVRAALTFYYLQRLGLDRESEKKSPKARQIVLLNPKELEAYRSGV
jgi:hypothetical protein